VGISVPKAGNEIPNKLYRRDADVSCLIGRAAQVGLVKSLAAMKENPHVVALGKMGGSKGGKIRAAKLTPMERSASARKAALARWAKEKGSKKTSPES
jgi:hypothetical protein